MYHPLLTKYLLFILLTLIIVVNSRGVYNNYRLPKSIKPIRYNITIEPTLEADDLKLATFNGSVAIEIKVLESTDNITIHIQNISIIENSISVTDHEGNLIARNYVRNVEENNFYLIHLEKELQKGHHYTLSIENFIGSLNDDKEGFFLAEYEENQGQKRRLAVTHMAPFYARQAFPCFDEPALKATFVINLIRPEKYNSVSNEELLTTINLGGGRFQDIFRETVLMPTYSVAFVISPYIYKNYNERIRIFGSSEKINNGQGDYVLPEADKILKIMEEYTEIHYPLGKMDLLGVPDSFFQVGAMENWGLVIFSEANLFLENTSSILQDLQNNICLTAHELAHQWFGNLVTAKWWKYLWLNEGFASFFEYKIADMIKPSWRLKEQYVIDHQHDAFLFDIKPNTQIMNYEFTSSTDTPSMTIIYNKACAVIRMTEHLVSQSVFKNGIRKYLASNKYDVVEAADLYKAFQEAIDESDADINLGNMTVLEILSTWDSSEGYPLITVARNYENGSITLTQETFREDNVTDHSTIWYIPITYVFEKDNHKDFLDTKTDFWLKTQNLSVNENVRSDGWLLLNKLQAGYYRVNYDETNWRRLIDALHTEHFTDIHPINRAQLIYDSFGLAEINKLPIDIPLRLSAYLKHEIDFIPVKAFLDAVHSLDSKLASYKEYDIFQNYVKDALSCAYNYLGPNEKPKDTHTDKLNRMGVLKRLCQFGHAGCQDAGLQKLQLWKADGFSSISPDLETQLLCGAMQIATNEDWQFLYQQYLETNGTYQKNIYIQALGCAQNEAILERFLDTVFNLSSAIVHSDRVEAIDSIATTNRNGLEKILKRLDLHRADIESNCSGDDQATICLLVEDSIWRIARRMSNNKQLAEIQTYKNWIESADDSIKENIEWAEKYGPQISQYLLEYYKNSTQNAILYNYN